ncbi:phosphotransferase family protein [Allonocardiopsis opalescens]|uniref:Scyllo-inosamine 4-kinase n=1 Tax=Allonocardiopsis opalescens TaxID=1144618 RepID=A0A2T0Q593_9ACTN|nr:phosphotransferase [Allonocardiopsis opalescens]PRX98966.1 scyllo-inosamine 4-kinase [Allonocardiopsis opalescens]
MTDEGSDPPRSAAARVAAEVLAARGLGLADASPGRGWTNATWLTREFVVRVARRPGPADLVREASLAALLPAEVGYPEIVDLGVAHGHEWVITRRIPARNLEDAWPKLSARQRADALEQVWSRVEHVHRVDLATAAAHARPRSPFFPATAAEAAARLDRLRAAGLLSGAQAAALGEAMDRFWAALPAAPAVLNHGDLGMCNALWRDGRVVSVLDFEFAVVAPLAVDLNEILKFAFAPSEGDGPVREAAMGIARTALPASGGTDVLLGYAIMLESWLTENELAADPADGPADPEPHRLLTSLADGGGGHLAPLLAAPAPGG